MAGAVCAVVICHGQTEYQFVNAIKSKSSKFTQISRYHFLSNDGYMVSAYLFEYNGRLQSVIHLLMIRDFFISNMTSGVKFVSS